MLTNHRLKPVLVLLALISFLSGCASTNMGGTHQSPAHLLTLTIVVSSKTLTVGGTTQLTITGEDQYGNPFIASPTFTITGNSVTINGVTVTAAAAGSSTVTAEAFGITSNPITFTVNAPQPLSQSITFNGVNSAQTVGNTYTVSATASSGLPVTITPLQPNICNLTTAIAPGNCTLQATQAGNSQYAAATPVNFNITVSAVPAALKSITISPMTATIEVGQNQAYTAQGIDQYGQPFAISPAFTATGTGTLNGATVTGTAKGSESIYASSGGINSPTATLTIVPVPPALASITLAAGKTTLNVGDTTVLTATGTDQYGNTFSIAPTFNLTGTAVSLNGTTVTGVSAGSASFTATSGSITSNSVSFTVNQVAQSIAFGAAPTGIQIGNPFSVTATSTSGLPVTLTSLTPSICSTTAAIAAGTCTLQATQAGNIMYSAATPVSLSFTVSTDSQTINFPAMPSVASLATLAPAATATSGLAVTYTSLTPSVCSPTQALTSGLCTIQASQAGNATYSAATSVSQSFTVGLADQTITFNALPAHNVGDALSFSATSTSGLTVSLASITPSICSTTQALSAGQCIILATQAGNNVYAAASSVSQSFTVSLVSQTISFSLPSTLQALSTISPSATATSGLTVTFTSLTPSVCSLTQLLTDGTCTIEADQAGNGTYAAATPVTANISVTLAPQTINFPAPSVNGTAFSVNATATSNLPVTFQSDTPTICSVDSLSGAGTELLSGTCTIEADQPGNATYAAATPVTQSITIGQSLAAISVTPANASAYPGFPVAFTASAFDQFNQVMAVQPTFTWTSDNGAVVVDTNGSATGSAVSNPTTANITASASGVSSAAAVFTLNPAVLTTVTLSPTSAEIQAPSGSTVFSVIEQDQFGRPMAPLVACTYKSDNTAAATIDGTGTVVSTNSTPNTLTANISATCGGLTTSSVVLTVDPQVRYAKTLVATPNPATVMQTITPTLPQNTSVTITAYDEFNTVFATPMIDVDPGYDTTIVTATALNSSEGNQIVVQGVGIGSTTIHVHIDTDDSVSTTFTVNVTACTQVNICYVPVLTTITLSGGTTGMEYQGTTSFNAQGLDQKGGGISTTFTWGSTDTTVLSVNPTTGAVEAVGVGTASVTATSNGVTGTSATITVTPAPAAPISIVSIYPVAGAARVPASAANNGTRPELITVNGTGFASGATVTFGSDILPATFVSSSQLTVSVPATNLAVTSDTQVPLFVTNPANPDFTQAISNTTIFTVFTGGMVTVTFDDAYESAYQNGIPVFNSAGLPITAFVMTGNSCVSLGTCPNGVRSDGYPWGWNNANCPPATFPLPVTQWNNTLSGCIVGVEEGNDYMTWAEVKALSQTSGNEIGAHTRSHNSLSTISSQDQVGEIQGAMQDLQAEGLTVNTLAYPYGDYGCLTATENAKAACAKVAGNGTGTTAPVIGGLVQSAGYNGARSSDVGLEGDQSGNPAGNLPLFLASYAGDVTSGDAMTTAQLTAIVQSATSKGAWVIFLFHRVDECNAGTFPYPANACPSGQTANPISIDSTSLQGLAQYLQTNGIRTVTISDGLAMQGLNGRTQVPVLFPTE